MSKIRSAPKCGKKPSKKRLCRSILSKSFEINPPCARETLPQSSISNANCVQAQPGSLRYPSPKNSPPDCFSRRNCVSPVGSFESPLLQFDKKRRFQKWNLLFWRRRGDSLRYPSPKNSPPDCFSRKSSHFFGRLIRVPPFSNSIKKEGPTNGTFFFWRRRGDSLRYPSPKNSPPDCFSRKSSRFFGRLIRVPPSPIR